ncbi:Alpha-type protein kinase domain-containing protein [Balamuthia mandrillaris]
MTDSNTDLTEEIQETPTASPHPASPLSNGSVVAGAGAAAGKADDGWGQLRNLQALYEEGFITVTEYKDRKSQIVDTLTGTRSVSRPSSERVKFMENTTVVHRPPPDFATITAEKAIRYTYDLETQSWSQQEVEVKIEKEPFARGGLRKAYHLLDLDLAAKYSDTYVAKMAIDPCEDREVYFQDAEMQMEAKRWAELFNYYNPPKRIEFIDAWLLELVDRPGRPICGVEKYVAGPYRKHNNNFGYVSDDERNTPQAFSHFTYEASKKTLLICDIQGVNDLYTDPQIHNEDGIGFGKGNLGERGFERFLATHRCNHICRYLKLPSINAKLVDAGTKGLFFFSLHTIILSSSFSHFFLAFFSFVHCFISLFIFFVSLPFFF